MRTPADKDAERISNEETPPWTVKTAFSLALTFIAWTLPQRSRAKWRSDLAAQDWGRGAGLWKCQKSCHHREQQVLRRIAFTALKDEEYDREEGRAVGGRRGRQRRNDAEEQVREKNARRPRGGGG